MKTEMENAIANLSTKIEEMRQRTIAMAAPLKNRYAELREEMAFLEREIRRLDEDWKPDR